VITGHLSSLSHRILPSGSVISKQLSDASQ